jgi:hypothetical protein
MQNQTLSRPFTFGLAILSALWRLVPHIPNVTPLGGSSLFAGSRLAGFLAYLLPVVVMIATDPFVGGYTWASPVIYACFMINVWIGRRMLRQVTPIRVGLAAFLCSLQFFVLTNLALWVGAVVQHNPIYSADLNGLITCYTLAIPFWGRTLAGDLLFTAAIFGLYELLNRRTAHAKTPVTA